MDIEDFWTCKSLESVKIGNNHINATNAPTLESSAIPDNVTEIGVPSASLSAYQTATNWSYFAGKMVGV